MPIFKDITGQKYGRLTAIKRVASRCKQTYFLFRCDCGVEKEIHRTSVTRGVQVSCGCAKIKHGHSHSKREGRGRTLTYQSWESMKYRCSGNVPDRVFKNYAGKGVHVCDRWLDFSNFLFDMGVRPSKNHTIDRIDSDKSYYPGNCRWVEWHVQNHNRKSISNSSSRFKGVHWCNTRNRWLSKIVIKKNNTYLGSFKTEIEAARAYNIAAKLAYGDFVRLNERGHPVVQETS